MPSTESDVITGVSTSTSVKSPCRAASTAALTLSGLQTVDGVSLADGDRVLVKNQATAAENGIYYARTSAWGRTEDWDGARDARNGTLIPVTSGTANANTIWRAAGTDPIDIGTSSVTFTLGFYDGTLRDELSSVLAGDGAALVGSEDAGGYFTGDTVEEILQEIGASTSVAGMSVSRSSNTILAAADKGKLFRATASFTQTLTAAATLGSAWNVWYRVDTGFVLTIDPNGGELINGLSTVKVAGGGFVFISCDGSAFRMGWLADATDVVSVADSATPDWRRDVNGSKNLSMDSGTTAITLPVLRNGEEVSVKFGTARPLTQGGSFVLAGSVSRTLTANDTLNFRGEASSLIREISARNRRISELSGFAESGELTVSFNAQITFAHGLGAVPKNFQTVLRCKTADLNYAVDDEIVVGGGAVDASADAIPVAFANATVVGIVNGAGITILNKTTFTRAGITGGSWRFVFRAWL